jgi:hypothetical protein
LAIKGLSEGKGYTKERTDLVEVVRSKPNFVPDYFPTKDKKDEYIKKELKRFPDFWWDIYNDIMMSFDPGIMKKLPELLKGSWDFIRKNDEEYEAECQNIKANDHPNTAP